MKFINYLLGTALLLAVSTSSYAQKYKVPADTGKLNLEYVKVQNDIADLDSKLTTAQSDLPGFQTKQQTPVLMRRLPPPQAAQMLPRPPVVIYRIQKMRKKAPIMPMAKQKTLRPPIITWVNKTKK